MGAVAWDTPLADPDRAARWAAWCAALPRLIAEVRRDEGIDSRCGDAWQTFPRPAEPPAETDEPSPEPVTRRCGICFESRPMRGPCPSCAAWAAGRVDRSSARISERLARYQAEARAEIGGYR